MNLRILLFLLIYLCMAGCRSDPVNKYDFKFRFNSSGPTIGKAHLIQAIESTRQAYSDFNIALKERSMVGDNVCLMNWEITGNSGNSVPFSMVGFSVIFHDIGRITGEWISYSDIEWVKGLGYKLIPSEGSR